MSEPKWWGEPRARQDLDQVLFHVNTARDARSAVDACRSLADAVNKLFTLHNALSGDAGGSEGPQSDSASLRGLLRSLGPELDGLLACDAIAAFAEFRPLILDHYVLRDYLIADVPPEAEVLASEAHERFAAAHSAYAERTNSRTRQKLVFALARMLWVVRSNMAHGDKSRGGPDRDRATRNAAVGEVAGAVFQEVADAVLCSPNRRLAVYGTLAPGEVNHFVIEPVGGTWSDVELEGEMGEWAGYPMFEWVTSGGHAKASLVESQTLASFWPRLDQFETDHYARHLVPFTADGVVGVTNCYVRADDYMG